MKKQELVKAIAENINQSIQTIIQCQISSI